MLLHTLSEPSETFTPASSAARTGAAGTPDCIATDGMTAIDARVPANSGSSSTGTVLQCARIVGTSSMPIATSCSRLLVPVCSRHQSSSSDDVEKCTCRPAPRRVAASSSATIASGVLSTK